LKIPLKYPDGSDAGYVEYDGKISKVYNQEGELLFTFRGRFPPRGRDYSWIDKVLSKGLKDSRKRFILFVASRYLMNVKKLDEDEAVQIIRDFYYKDGSGKLYDAWVRSVLRGVKEKGFRPWSLKKIQDNDKEMYQEIQRVLQG
jgi:hypothetical protein